MDHPLFFPNILECNNSPAATGAKVQEDLSGKEQHTSKLFGIPGYPPLHTGGRSFDYDAKYPEDPPGEEASENARIWMIYNDEAGIYDDDMIRGFRDTLDSLLVFAALFSAVVTTLLVQTVTSLEPDYAEMTTFLR
ncbi:hypothetical protein DL96DRAFT_1714731 [Flagelloscypha sp. PMI_526]|nr:hypothetical protein DL96DRAFT_1714731 [Flagelloscypha sp. PMI_526]